MEAAKLHAKYSKANFSTCEEPETIGVSEHYMIVARAKQ